MVARRPVVAVGVTVNADVASGTVSVYVVVVLVKAGLRVPELSFTLERVATVLTVVKEPVAVPVPATLTPLAR
jgi:hypothetical protein